MKLLERRCQRTQIHRKIDVLEMSKIRLLIADDVEETRSIIIKFLNIEVNEIEVVGEASNGEEVLKQIPRCEPDVILMDINMPVMNGLEATEKITKKYPSVIVIIMSVQAESEYLKRAMFSGAKEYVIKPLNYDTLIDTIRATYKKFQDTVAYQKAVANGEKDAKIITFYSAKGGVGKSVISINTSIILSKIHKKKTILIDFDLRYGDISMLINQHTEKTILDIIDDGELISYETVLPYLYQYNDHLDILLAPKNPEDGEYISKDTVEQIIKMFRTKYDFILMDTSVSFDDVTLTLLDLSELILFTTSMDMPSIKDTKLGLGVMKSLNYDNNKVKLLVNKATNKYGITINEIEDVFKNNFFATIPEDKKHLRLSVNKGNPICNNPKRKRSKMVKAIYKLCKKMIV